MEILDRLKSLPVVGTLVRLQQRYQADDADQYAASIAFFAFLSLFPLLAVAISVAGFVLARQPALEAEVVDTISLALEGFPGFEAILQPGDQQSTVGQVVERLVAERGGIGLVGVATLTVTGLKAVGAAMAATAAVFHVRIQLSGPRKLAYQLGALTGLGLLSLAGVAAASAAGASVGVDASNPVRLALSVGGTALTLALNFALFMVAYRVLAVGSGPSWRRLWPGSLLAAGGWAALQLLGASYVAAQRARFAVAGVLTGVIALLLLLYLAGRLYLYGAELSALLYAPGADMAARQRGRVVYRGEDAEVLPEGPLRARPGAERGLAAPIPDDAADRAGSGGEAGADGAADHRDEDPTAT